MKKKNTKKKIDGERTLLYKDRPVQRQTCTKTDLYKDRPVQRQTCTKTDLDVLLITTHLQYKLDAHIGGDHSYNDVADGIYY